MAWTTSQNTTDNPSPCIFNRSQTSPTCLGVLLLSPALEEGTKFKIPETSTKFTRLDTLNAPPMLHRGISVDEPVKEALRPPSLQLDFWEAILLRFLLVTVFTHAHLYCHFLLRNGKESPLAMRGLFFCLYKSLWPLPSSKQCHKLSGFDVFGHIEFI